MVTFIHFPPSILCCSRRGRYLGCETQKYFGFAEACLDPTCCLTHRVHVNTIGVGPGMLEVLLKALAEWVGDLVEADEFLHPQHLGVVTGGA